MLIIRQIDWHDVGWPMSCNAFTIARFLVLFEFYKLLGSVNSCRGKVWREGWRRYYMPYLGPWSPTVVADEQIYVLKYTLVHHQI